MPCIGSDENVESSGWFEFKDGLGQTNDDRMTLEEFVNKENLNDRWVQSGSSSEEIEPTYDVPIVCITNKHEPSRFFGPHLFRIEKLFL